MGHRHWPRQRLLAAAVTCACLLAASLLQGAAAGELINTRPGNVLCLILTDCAKYQDWQTLAAAFAWRHSGQPGSMVRVANCNEKDTKDYDKKMLDYVKTHMAPQMAWNEELKDWYAAYNKPGAVVDYFKHNSPKEEWIVVLDSDMLLHKPFRPEELPLQRGWAYGGHYDYLVGTDNALAMRHVPDIVPRNDTLAGRVGRRGDRVGGPYYMHRDDLSRLAPNWYNWTKIMRTDMEAYKDSGDTASKKGDRIWIAEMYGYSFGAAKSNVWHIWKEDFMLYPSYTPNSIPYVLHYGLIYHVGGWTFDKHFYFDFDSHKCPPWDLNQDKPKGGIFPPPPGPKQLERKDYLSWYKDMIAVSVITTVNAALCDYHVRNCDPSPQLTEVCNKAFQLFHEVDQEIKDLEWVYNCTDHNKECPGWAERGECTKMPAYMSDHCRLSCKQCVPPKPRVKGPNDKLLTVEELSKEIGKTAAPAGAPAVASPSPNPSPPPPPPPSPPPPSPLPPPPPVQQAAAATQQQQKDDSGEAEMRKKYPTSMLSFAALVKRCTDLQGLTEQQTRECVKAAAIKLEYPGTLGPTAAAAGGAAAATGAITADAGTAGREVKLEGAAAATNDLASLHAKEMQAGHMSGLGRAEEYLGRKMTGPDGGLGFVEQMCIILFVAGAVWFGYTRLQKFRLSRAKGHSRSE